MKKFFKVKKSTILSTWTEIGKGILKSSIVMYGSRVVADRILPAAEDFSKKAWKKAKASKATPSENKETHREARTKKVYDSDAEDLFYSDPNEDLSGK